MLLFPQVGLQEIPSGGELTGCLSRRMTGSNLSGDRGEQTLPSWEKAEGSSHIYRQLQL